MLMKVLASVRLRRAPRWFLWLHVFMFVVVVFMFAETWFLGRVLLGLIGCSCSPRPSSSAAFWFDRRCVSAEISILGPLNLILFTNMWF